MQLRPGSRHASQLVGPAVARAAWWTVRSTLQVRRQLAGGSAGPVVGSPPRLPAHAGRAVDAVLLRLKATCLERAFVQQRWLAGQGIVRDVVIGLPPGRFGPTPAHAWVDGMDPAGADGHAELHRIALPVRPTADRRASTG